MNKFTQKRIIAMYLSTQNDWVAGYKLRSISTPFGFLGNQADRRCREMFEDGKIERKLIGKFVFYRIQPLPVKIYSIEGMPNKQIKLTY